MATVKTNPTTTNTRPITRPNLVISGRVTDARGAPAAVDLNIAVALEAVVAHDADATVYEVYGVTLRSGLDGRFADSCDIADDVRVLLSGWVKCSVQFCAEVPGSPARTKVVRWMRPSSDEVINGLNALLGDVTVML